MADTAASSPDIPLTGTWAAADRGLGQLARGMAYLAGAFAILMMLHITADVGLKLAMNRPIAGTLEIVSFYYMVAIVFIPIALTDWQQEAITVDLFYLYFPRWLRFAATLFSLTALTGAYAGLAWLTGEDALRYIAKNEVAMGSATVLVWPARVMMVVAIALAALVNLRNLILFITGHDRSRWLKAEMKIEE